jgi:hypothetical protein
MHASGGILTHDSSKRSAADLRLRPRGHWDRQVYNHRLIIVMKTLYVSCDVRTKFLSTIYVNSRLPVFKTQDEAMCPGFNVFSSFNFILVVLNIKKFLYY